MRITEQSRLYIVEALRASARSDEQAVAGYIVAAPSSAALAALVAMLREQAGKKRVLAGLIEDAESIEVVKGRG